MPFTKEEIIKMINLDEPDYTAIVAKLTAEDIPTLVELSKHPNPAIATKAISCLGFMKTDKALNGIKDAAKHANPTIRIAAAHSLRNMSAVEGSVKIVDILLDDNDIGVRKFALKTVEHAKISSLKEKVRALNLKEINPGLKILSEEVLKKLK